MADSTFRTLSEPRDIVNAIESMPNGAGNNLFTSAYWFKAAINNSNIAFTQGQDAALFLQSQSQYGFKIAELAGEPFIQYNDAINNDTANLDNFLDQSKAQLKQMGVDALYLHNIRADAHIFDYCQNNGITIAQKRAPWLNLSKFENFEQYKMSIKDKNIRRLFNKLFRELDCQVKIHVDADISAPLVSKIIASKVKQLEQQGGTSRVFAEAAKVEQLVKMFTSHEHDVKTIIITLEVEGEIISASICHAKDGIVCGYINTMDERYRKYAPGNALVMHTIKWALENDYQTLDLLAPEDPYKSKWVNESAIEVVDIIIPLTFKGKIYASIFLKFLRPKLKSAYLYTKGLRAKRALKK